MISVRKEYAGKGCRDSRGIRRGRRSGNGWEERTERTGGGEEKITTIVHQAYVHVPNGNHGNNYRADRQTVWERVKARERQGENETMRERGRGRRRRRRNREREKEREEDRMRRVEEWGSKTEGGKVAEMFAGIPKARFCSLWSLGTVWSWHQQGCIVEGKIHLSSLYPPFHLQNTVWPPS